MRLDLQSEQYAPTGNISGSGVARSLGSPSLDRLRLLVRETVQNAWDARESENTPVRLRFRVRTLMPAGQRALSEMLSELPGGSPCSEQIAKSVDGKRVAVIEIADYKTRGLGGPVRADRTTSAEGEPANFVKFFRNIGSPRDKAFGGGTYGYGKSSVFAMSRCATVVGYTRSTDVGVPVCRLIAANISEPFDNRRKRYTGRHWWGIAAKDGTVDPLDSEQAQRAAASIGLEQRKKGDPGTTLMVIDPLLDARSLQQTANAIAESLAWFFWPKMLREGAGPPAMQFEVEFEGIAVEVPGPATFPPLSILAAAMKTAKSAAGVVIKCERPSRVLGRLGLERGPVASRVIMDTGNEEPLIPERSSHVALMRPAELVVRYLVGPQLPSDYVEYGGVFVCDDDMEPHFAAAEPPAHDDWVPDHLEGDARTFVRVAVRRVEETVSQYANPLPGDSRASQQQSLAVIGDALGGVLIGQGGSRVGSPPQRPGRPGNAVVRPGDVSVSDPEFSHYAIVRKTPCVLFRVKVFGRSNGPVKIEASPFVVLEGGSSPEALGLASPQVLAWQNEHGDPLSTGRTATLRIAGETTIAVAVSIPGDCAIGVKVGLGEKAQ